jgi:N-acetylmuramoyl-L-alanine amidase CwlA
LKTIKGGRPSALITSPNNKSKSPVSSPTILSPKDKEKTVSPTTKGINNKNLGISAVVPSSDSFGGKQGNLAASTVIPSETIKPNNRFAVSTVSKKEG